VVISIHWGGNWGYRVPREQAEFARRLIDLAAVDLVHGHSSHHPKGLEIHCGKTILYGCGDFINDYEGISGHEQFRGDLGVMYFPRLDARTGELRDLELVALARKRLRLERAADLDCQWLCGVLNAEGRRLGTAFEVRPGSRFTLCGAATGTAIAGCSNHGRRHPCE
jgi:poly-gamma-glutamate synthesis protein (capsule biosynthesis protein)